MDEAEIRKDERKKIVEQLRDVPGAAVAIHHIEKRLVWSPIKPIGAMPYDKKSKGNDLLLATKLNEVIYSLNEIAAKGGL